MTTKKKFHVSISRLFLNIMHIFTSPTLHFTSTKSLVDWSLDKPIVACLSLMLFVFLGRQLPSLCRQSRKKTVASG